METVVDALKYTRVLKSVPDRISDSEILNLLQTNDINWEYIDTIKEMTDLNDEVISVWLNISVRSFRSYRQSNSRLKENLKEQVIVLLSLIKHGIQVFGTKDRFDQWLTTENFFLDGKTPVAFLNTVTGIRFIDDRLTAMEYGDNV
jgi:putative toxin-antitoxin system antitoxin component (TIGR02293 family)